MEILSEDKYSEYENFVKTHPNGSVMQSTLWHGVKNSWGHDVVVIRGSSGEIVAGVSVLVKKIPGTKTAMMYAPRGFVCDYVGEKSSSQIEMLKAGVDLLAKKYAAYIFKVDPDVKIDNTSLLNVMDQLGFVREYGPSGFETIQTRFNYRLYLDGKTQEDVLANMHHKTRYNIRLAERKGVEVKIAGKQGLDDFVKIMKVTGERDGFSVRPKIYFENMLNALGENIRLYMAYYEGRAIAGAITSNYGDKTCYIYGASDNEFRNVMAPYLVQWEMIKWAFEQNSKVYDFMGISGEFKEDDPLYGLYRFKNGFTGVVDELPGEFNYTYKPMTEKFVNMGIKLSEGIRAVKRKLR